MKVAPYVNAGETLFLGPGDVWFGRGEGIVSTLLGSCVAMTLWHPPRRLAGMCHFVLPSRPAAVRTTSLDGRYGDEAMQLLVREAVTAGCDMNRCEVGIFGGGWMFETAVRNLAPPGSAMDIPSRNIAQARTMTRALHINVLSEHVGGGGHRQIRMSLVDGQVRVTHMPKVQDRTPWRPENSDIVPKHCS